MTRNAAIASDITVLLAMMIAGPMIGWFFVKGWKNGLVETRFGNFVKSERPAAFWLSMIFYGAGLLVVTAGTVMVLADLFGSFVD
ncbi:hypothetical protein Q4610_03900 [Sphingobium sp. HBC34]|uniref:Uncharacterized protein n=1 Tax=Sphingobium cyanobacteriorum TaxID=3063954 RepID=A0ABT8ZIC4_9SPHN|nr:hypothetical protein [Sphingobium sp. HBC34]MDO7834181.1 hypothetical protein [Sphingobium sp. HBC34]